MALAPVCIFWSIIGLLLQTVNLFKTVCLHIGIEKKLQVQRPTFIALVSLCIT